MAIGYLGLGSNIGNRKELLISAIEQLKLNPIKVLKVSAFIDTEPVGGPPNQDNFLNGAVKIMTGLAPLELLDVTQSIENKLGRVRNEADGPRTIDIDILLYDNLVMHSDRLTIPHPRMHKRDFVLIPLNEIEPDIMTKYNHILQAGQS